MKKRLLILITACLPFFSCGDKKMTIAQYNETAVTLFNQSAEQIYEQRELLFDRELSDEENQKIVEELYLLLDSCILIMNDLNYPEEAGNFHNSILQIYYFQKDSIMPLLSESITYPAQSKDFYRVWREFDQKGKRNDQILEEMEEHQKELARKANAQFK